MDPAQFLMQAQKKRLAPGYVFLGNELFSGDGCRKALVEAALAPEERESGRIEYDLAETSLDRVIEEARTLSLFALARLIVAYNAENVLGRNREAAEEEDASEPGSDVLDSYFRNPTPGVVLLFEAVRLNWGDRDERKKLERLAKFFSAVPVHVELRRFDEPAALEGARSLARKSSLRIADALLAELVEALGLDMARIANEIAKLAVYAADGREITRDTLVALVPEARTSGLFELTDALASRNRTRALEILDTLTRMDVYMQLQVNFLAGLFRHALAIKEGGARNENDVNRLFNRLGLPIWPARARQALDTARRFSRQQLERALLALFEADRNLRRERPDDRVVMEKLVWELTR
ncbi:MAG TPA: DNA polymerase III subunit delta [Bryobacterales bacterium]|nr:DNA polymerase III subunit delta [Bryobacterales bacterium]